MNRDPEPAPAPPPTEPVPAPPDRDRRRFFWALCGACVLTVLSIALYLAGRSWPELRHGGLYSEWSVWLPLVQLMGLVLLLWRFGLPRSARGWLSLVLINAWVVGVVGLFDQGHLGVALFLAADLLLRVGVLCIWGLALAGVPMVVVWLWRFRRPPRPALPLVRVWFSCVVLLLTAEPLMAVLERAMAQHELGKERLTLPERLAEPPPGELRIVSLGESSMHGVPYEPKFGIPHVMAWRVQAMYPEHRVVSENLAVPGQSLRQAIESLRHLRVRPHLIVLYGGHNEFFHELEELAGSNRSPFGVVDPLLRRSPTFRMLDVHLRQTTVLRSMESGLSRTLVEPPLASPAVIEHRRQRLERHLEQLAEFGRTHGITMLWYVPAGTESDFEPNRSTVAVGTSAGAIAAIESRHAQALERERAGDWEGAARLHRLTLEAHPTFAESHFRLAECLLQLGDIDGARHHFQEALEQDGHPVRMTRPFRETIAENADRNAVSVVRADEVLRPHTVLGIIDRTMINDNVHPTLRGYYLLGMAGADAIAARDLLEPAAGAPARLPEMRLADALAAMEIGRSEVATALRRTAGSLRLLARLRYERTRRDAEADQLERLAARMEAGEIKPGDEGTEALE